MGADPRQSWGLTRWSAIGLAAIILTATAPFLGVSLSQDAKAEHRPWTKETRLPIKPEFPGVTTINDSIYVFGGYRNNAPNYDEILRYTPRTDEVEVLNTTLPNDHGATAVSDGDKVHIFSVPGDIWTYNSTTGEIKERDPGLPSHGVGVRIANWDPRDRPEDGCAEGCAYIFGGDGDDCSGNCPWLFEYNPAEDERRVLRSNWQEGYGRAAAAWDHERDVAWTFGWWRTTWSTFDAVKEVWEYDPIQDSIRTASTTTWGLQNAASAWDGSSVHLVSYRAVWEWDPANETLTQVRSDFGDPTPSRGVWLDDNFWMIGSGNKIIRYSPGPDHPPVAKVKETDPVECVDRRGTFDLEAISSYDPDGEAITYDWWSFEDVTFGDPDGERTTASVPHGAHDVKLTVREAEDTDLYDTTTETARVVDTLPPDTGADLSGDQGAHGWWRSPVTVTVIDEDRCGIGTFYHNVDGQGFEAGQNVTVNPDGTHTVQHYGVDLGNQTSPVRDVTFRIDKTPPTINRTRPVQGNAYAADVEVPGSAAQNTTTVVVGNVTVTANATDPVVDGSNSTVDRVEILVDGELRDADATRPYRLHWNASRDGAGLHTLTTRAVDRAGNADASVLNVTTVPTTQEGVEATGQQLEPVCRILLSEEVCHAVATLNVDELVGLLMELLPDPYDTCRQFFSHQVCGVIPPR